MSIFPMLIAFNVAFPTSAVQNKSPIVFFGKIARKVNANVTLAVDGNIVRAASWSFKREDLYMLSSSELEYGLGYHDSEHRLIDSTKLKFLVDDHVSRGQSIAMLCKSPCAAQNVSLLPAHSIFVTNGHYDFWYVENAPNTN